MAGRSQLGKREQAGRRILVDIGHPAHVHFFKHSIRSWQADGHEVLVTSRAKECALDLLDEMGIPHRSLSHSAGGGAIGLLRELLSRNRSLLKLSREWRPDVMCGVGGIFVAQVGFLLRIPSVVFYDTEMATLQNLLTYPFASKLVVPDCYRGRVPRRKTVRYRGYHELAYLAPDKFCPNLPPPGGDDRNTFLVRVVAWNANHDFAHRGWSAATLLRVVRLLQNHGEVVISSEVTLPAELEGHRYTGPASEMHALLAKCRAYVGESATMASEAAVLGVPSIYAAPTRRGYLSDQAERYGLVWDLSEVGFDAIANAIHNLLQTPKVDIQRAHQQLLNDCTDVTAIIQREVLNGANRP